MGSKVKDIASRKFVLNEETMPVVKQLAEFMPGGFYIYKAENEEVLYANSEVFRFFKCDQEDLIGKSFKTFVEPEDLDYVDMVISQQNTLNEDKYDFIEYRIRTKEKELRKVMHYGHLIPTRAYGDVYTVFLYDVTDRVVRAQEDRRKAEVIQGLSREYNAIYLVDFERQFMIPYSLNNAVSKSMRYAFNKSLDYRTTMQEFADAYVYSEDFDTFMFEVSEERIRKRVDKEGNYSFTFRRYNERHILEYVKLSVFRVEDKHRFTRVIMAYKNVTDELVKEQEEAAARRMNAVVRVVANDYLLLVDVNLVTEKEVRYFLSKAEERSIPDWDKADQYRESVVRYARYKIVPEDQERFIEASKLENLRKVLGPDRDFVIEYDAIIGGQRKKLQCRFTLDSDKAGEPHMLIGIRSAK